MGNTPYVFLFACLQVPQDERLWPCSGLISLQQVVGAGLEHSGGDSGKENLNSPTYEWRNPGKNTQPLGISASSSVKLGGIFLVRW